MKEVQTYYINPMIPGLKFMIPYMIEFFTHKPYKVIVYISDDFSGVAYKIKSKSYYKSIYLTKEMLDTYFVTDKEYNKFFFNLKMDKLLK